MIKEELGLPEEYLKCLAGESTRAFKFSKPRSGKEALSCESQVKNIGGL